MTTNKQELQRIINRLQAFLDSMSENPASPSIPFVIELIRQHFGFSVEEAASFITTIVEISIDSTLNKKEVSAISTIYNVMDGMYPETFERLLNPQEGD